MDTFVAPGVTLHDVLSSLSREQLNQVCKTLHVDDYVVTWHTPEEGAIYGAFFSSGSSIDDAVYNCPAMMKMLCSGMTYRLKHDLKDVSWPQQWQPERSHEQATCILEDLKAVSSAADYLAQYTADDDRYNYSDFWHLMSPSSRLRRWLHTAIHTKFDSWHENEYYQAAQELSITVCPATCAAGQSVFEYMDWPRMKEIKSFLCG